MTILSHIFFFKMSQKRIPSEISFYATHLKIPHPFYCTMLFNLSENNCREQHKNFSNYTRKKPIQVPFHCALSGGGVNPRGLSLTILLMEQISFLILQDTFVTRRNSFGSVPFLSCFISNCPDRPQCMA